MKVLITADIHIDDFSDFNYTDKSRLYQFRKLADRLVEIGTEHGCEEHWILGDIINRPNALSYIIHEAKKFIEKQCDHFTTVRYILGQHDLTSKSSNLKIEDSLVNLFDYDNFIYMDKKILEMDNHVYGFMNWRVDQNLDWLGDTKLDVLFGHYTKSTLFGQDIDDSKFDLMIHGDIHNDQEIGKFISVGNPLQHNLGSLDNGSCLIFDTETAKYERLRIDPDHTRFLRMAYTSDRVYEGFQGPLQYNVFRPEIEVETVKEVKTITWENIDSLATNTCIELGLGEIHGEVTSNCIDYSEIDFNFQLNSLWIHGYRSIVDMKLDFRNGDRVALLGYNGSGKSSIIKALRASFENNSVVGQEVSDYVEPGDYWVVVNLTYQNKVYEITKGPEWGLKIDGIEQVYSGVRVFESDLRTKLPFIDYLNLIFISSGSSSLDGQLGSSERIDLISRFYRFDRIRAYNETAQRLLEECSNSLSKFKSELEVQTTLKSNYELRLKDLDEVKDMDESEIEKQLEDFKSIREAREAYIQQTATLNSKRESQAKLKVSLESIDRSLDLNPEEAKKSIELLKVEMEDVNQKYEELYQITLQFEIDVKRLDEITQLGSSLRVKIDSLNQKRCPECGGEIRTEEALRQRTEIESDLEKLRLEWVELDKKLSAMPAGRGSKDFLKNQLIKLKEEYKLKSEGINLLGNKISRYETSLSHRQAVQDDLDKITREIEELESHRLPEVSLSYDQSKMESDLGRLLALIEERKFNMEMLSETSQLISKLEEDARNSIEREDKLSKYIEVTSMTGVIYEQLLKQLAAKFTTSEVKYEVDSGLYRGKRFINFNAYYSYASGKMRSYESCSSGQKIICDLDFLSKLFSVQVGLLVLDEYLKHLDFMNFSKACEILNDMRVNTIILSTHDPNLTAYNKRIQVALNEYGVTELLDDEEAVLNN